eukprot:m.344467 g.344467  ORF g.344467 m.344467 type:complete len:821 (+) comp24500_c0_seq1:185-2647(+)
MEITKKQRQQPKQCCFLYMLILGLLWTSLVHAQHLPIARHQDVCNLEHEGVANQTCGPNGICVCNSICVDCTSRGLTTEMLLQVANAPNTWPVNTTTVILLQNNSITSIPLGMFDWAPIVRILDLNINSITEIESNAFIRMPQLEELSLGNNSLTTLPADLYASNPYLLDTYLRYNKIIDLPASLFQKSSYLKYFDVSYNKLTMVHEDMFKNNSQLFALGLSYNPLFKLPPNFFSGNPAMSQLGMSGCRFTSFPKGIFDPMPVIYGLDLFNNSLTWISADLFANNTGLTQLSLGQNAITQVDTDAFLNNHDLTTVDFNQNLLSAVPNFKNISRLDTVFFDNNNIDDLLQAKVGLDNMLSDNVINNADTKVPFFSIANNPVVCVFNTATYEGYNCDCSRPYIKTVQGKTNQGQDRIICVLPTPPSHEAQIIGGSIGGLFGGLLLALIILTVSRRYKKISKNLGLHMELLANKEAEMDELIRVWEISQDEVTLVRRIDGDSEGAFGEVWYAEWDGLGVAVKKLRQMIVELDEFAAADFEKEVDSLRKCRHRNIVRFFGAGKWGDVPFLVAELMEMGSLSSYLRRTKDDGSAVDISWAQKINFCLDVQTGMQYIHTFGRVHRDLKTANVLLSKNLRAKISDFGTVKDIFQGNNKGQLGGETRRKSSVRRRNSEKQLGRRVQFSEEDETILIPKDQIIGTNMSKTMTSGVGTPLYMAPEVLRGDKYGPSADVWSFGVVLWEIALQVRPDLSQFTEDLNWSGPFMLRLEKALTNGRRLPLGDDECPPGYAGIFRKCQELVPGNRLTFAEIGDLLDTLRDNFQTKE